ncbi:MAG: phosphatidate cytidylyltransferase, partial [Proteobacteria bacterium]|nr:phosphatidate cytidylyltransferase [Pseudomonadota bacterium]
GRRFGQLKLLPAVSPGKSMMGLLGGLITAMLLGAMAIGVMIDDELREAPLFWLSMFLMVALISVLGDLTVSMLKRNRGIKDSSGLLPGHGGFLDRLDSLFSAAPFFCGLLMLSGRLV